MKTPALPVLETIPFLDFLFSTELPLELLDDFVEPKHVQAIEKHSKHKGDILEMPRQTRLANGIVAMLPCGGKDSPPKIGTQDYSEREEGKHKEPDIERYHVVVHERGSHETQVDCRYLKKGRRKSG